MIRNRFPVIATLTALLLATTAAGVMRQQGNNLRGKLRNSSGISLPRILVTLQSSNGTPIGQTVTNNEGDFFFGGLSETGYVIVIAATDYQPVTEQVDFSRRVQGPDESGETRTVEITLVPLGRARAAAGRVIFAQNVPQAARDAYERGLKLAREGKAPEGLSALQEAVRIFPDYFDARFALGETLRKSERLQEAIAEYEQARRINPKDDRVYQSFGLILTQQKKHAVAAAVFSEAARLNPADPQHPLLRGIALIDHASMIAASQSKAAIDERVLALSEAEKALSQAYQVSDRKLTIVHLQLARLYEKKGDRARAAAELERYLQKTPNDKNADALRDAVKKLRSQAAEAKTSSP